MADTNERAEVSSFDKVLDVGKKAKTVWEIGSWLISAGSAILAFITKVGGPVQFLVEVAFIGFASYIALWIAVPLGVGLLSALEKATGRTSTDVASAVVVVTFALVGAALVRFALFHPEVTQDLDGIGTAFGVVVGVVILLMPLFILWYARGSRPANN